MIKGGRRPARRSMAARAVMIKIIAHMIRISYILKFGRMTRPAIRRRALITVFVAINTLNTCVFSGQREARLAVVKGRRGPTARRVTLRAGVTEIIRDMIRIAHLLIVLLVTSPAIRDRVLEAAGVTVGALNRRVLSGQRECGQVVVERRRGPARRRVAVGAVMLKIVAHVIRVDDALVIGIVTGPTIGGSILIAARVAVGALNIDVLSG